MTQSNDILGKKKGDSKKISGCQELGIGWGGDRKMKRRKTEEFQGSEDTLSDTGNCPYIFVQTHKMYNTKKEP